MTFSYRHRTALEGEGVGENNLQIEHPSTHPTRFRVVEGHLADFGAPRKMLIPPKRNKQASSIFHRSIEDPLAYLAMV